MKKKITLLAFAGISLISLSCKKENSEINKTTDSVSAVKQEPVSKPLSGDYCFEKVKNKDSTIVKFRVLSNDDIRGEMSWHPWEKDGAVGTLTGKMISDNEIKFLYDNTIEGSRQSETKIMKVDGDKLYLKEGELTEDPANKGNMIYKDAAKAEYREILNKTKCE